jgi:hypothetical protein
MDLKIATERILLIKDQLSEAEAEEKAQAKKMDAFGTLDKFTGLFSRPSENDFEIVYKEHRYQPFWHIASKAKYVYDRNSHYQYDIKGQEVKAVTVEGKKYDVANGHLHIPVIEHCNQDLEEEVLIDGVSGAREKSLKDYTLKNVEVVEGGSAQGKSEKSSKTEGKSKADGQSKTDKLSRLAGKDTVLVPPQARVSGIIREMLAQMIQGIQADEIFEEKIEITCIDLYYRPVFAFQFFWKSKNKKAILEVDAVTGDTSTGSRTFSEYIGKALDRDFLFDIGADAAGIFIPGGSIAVKAAKKMMDKKGK